MKKALGFLVSLVLLSCATVTSASADFQEAVTKKQTVYNPANTFSVKIPIDISELEEYYIAGSALFVADNGVDDGIMCYQIPKDVAQGYGFETLYDLWAVFGDFVASEFPEMSFSKQQQPDWNNFIAAYKTTGMVRYGDKTAYLDVSFMETDNCYYMYVANINTPLSIREKEVISGIPETLEETGVVEIDEFFL